MANQLNKDIQYTLDHHKVFMSTEQKDELRKIIQPFTHGYFDDDLDKWNVVHVDDVIRLMQAALQVGLHNH